MSSSDRLPVSFPHEKRTTQRKPCGPRAAHALDESLAAKYRVLDDGTNSAPEHRMEAPMRTLFGNKAVVLAAIDFSPITDEVLAAGAELARGAGSELHVLHVLHDTPSESTATLSQDRDVGHASHIDELHVRLEKLGKQVAAPQRRIVLHTRIGRADEQIAQMAVRIGADIVVVGTQGLTGLKRLVLGSVAESVVRHAPCQVLTIRPKETPAWEQIAPACPDCAAVQQATGRGSFFCERHSQRHPRAHTYSEIPASYGIGSQTFRNA
jgi:nucleotide-binding universal stress UspA family protein